jgi:nucleoid-associated protein YgaU
MHRTYVRRRITLISVALCLAVVASGPIARAVDASPSPRLVGTRTYVVRPGDTLWSISSASDPERDPRAIVAEIASANHLGSTLTPGQVLVIPEAG